MQKEKRQRISEVLSGWGAKLICTSHDSEVGEVVVARFMVQNGSVSYPRDVLLGSGVQLPAEISPVLYELREIL